tara:strand:- start:3280 stop:3705 length:426 start_codon:yes stop_codon:yes gene_type:complete
MPFHYFFTVLLIGFMMKSKPNISAIEIVSPITQKAAKDTSQEPISTEGIIGKWTTWAKTNNKYRSNPYSQTGDLYFFKRDFSWTFNGRNKTKKGNWSLSDKNEIIITSDNKKTLYSITHFEKGFMILKSENTYLSLKKLTK